MGGAHGRKRRWIMKNFIQRSFRRELLVSFLAVSVLPLIVCCVFLIQMFKVTVGRDFEKKKYGACRCGRTAADDAVRCLS